MELDRYAIFAHAPFSRSPGRSRLLIIGSAGNERADRREAMGRMLDVEISTFIRIEHISPEKRQICVKQAWTKGILISATLYKYNFWPGGNSSDAFLSHTATVKCN
ncbi:predicted protein [Coccidioides posadasii str. Silveira]|uniref:Predicted protein n=1 Tax=Coccidioides posadasii (strain RMSCC 757 / Silveira) TaxID=443226 RepID=E9DH98_COCPS|nr:predicted protein [Coccidioides posadasii str. Silveira]